MRAESSLKSKMLGDYKKVVFKIDKDKFLDCLAIYSADMDKWPIELKKDMEQVFITSPGLL